MYKNGSINAKGTLQLIINHNGYSQLQPL